MNARRPIPRPTPRLLLVLAASCGSAFAELPFNAAFPLPAPAAESTPQAARQPSEQASFPAGRLILANGDAFSVRIDALDSSARILHTTHPLIRAALPIPFDAIDTFTAAPVGLPPQAQPWSIRLAAGDELRGDLAGLTDTHIALASPSLGSLNVPRSKVRLIRRPEAGRFLLEGLNKADNWKLSGQAQIENDALLLPGGSNAKLKFAELPARIEVSFNAEWVGHGTIFAFLFADSPATDGEGSAYNFGLRCGIEATLGRRLAPEGPEVLGQLKLSGEHSDGPHAVDYRLVLDLIEGRALIFVDGEPKGEGIRFAADRIPGHAIAFATRSSAPAKLSNLLVREWTGEIADESESPAEPLPELPRPAANELVGLASGDQLSGELLSIGSDSARIRSGLGEIDLPIGQVDQIAFATDATPAPAGAGILQVTLRDRSELSLKQPRISDGKLEGKSSLGIPLRIDPSQIASLRWNTALSTPATAQP